MKITKNITILSLILFAFQTISAQGPVDNNQYLIFNPHNSVTVDKPEFSKIATPNFPGVQKNTGALNNSINLTSIQCGPNNLPITLNYSTNGFRPSDYASEVGLGWNVSIGASISRIVNGLPDEGPFGFWNAAAIPTNRSNSYLYNVIKGIEDTKPDIFQYSLPSGESGSFLFDKQENVQFFPVQDIKVERIFYRGDLIFKITNKLGQVFHFTEFETKVGENDSGGNVPELYNYKISWLPTVIEYPDIKDSIIITMSKIAIWLHPKI